MFRCYRAERELATAAADKARASSAAATAAREQGRSLVWVGFGLVGWLLARFIMFSFDLGTPVGTVLLN